MLSSIKDIVTPATLKELSLRETYSITESNSQQMNNQIEIWKQECLKVPKEWWIGKFVKMEIAESFFTDDDLIVNKDFLVFSGSLIQSLLYSPFSYSTVYCGLVFAL